MTDPLEDLFRPAPVPQAQPMTYRQGVILTFDQNTLENTVRVSGSVFTNLPLLGLAEATTLQPGDVVGIMAVGDTWAILGQFVTPNTPAAVKAVTQLNQSIFAHSVLTLETTASTTYTDLATVGPQVTVNVGPTGRLLIMQSTLLDGGAAFAVTANYDARTSVALSGANVLAAADASIFGMRRFISLVDMASNQHSYVDRIPMATITVLSGLTPGNTTVTMKYRSPNATTLTFQARSLVVFRL